jgi:hypothetical protein
MKIRGDAPYLQHLLPCKFDYASFWSSPEKLARYLEDKGINNAWSKCAWDTSDPEWYGSKSMDDTIRMARTGWPEGAQRVSRIRDYVNASNPMRKEPVRYAMVGSTPSVPRAVAGDPKSMRAPMSIASKRRPIITLIHNMGAYSHVTSAAINNRSAVVAAIIDQIEAAGFCVEVLAVSPVHGYGARTAYPMTTGNTYSREAWRMCTTVLVKSSDQPTDIGRLAFGLGQTSMFRRLAFGDRCTEETAQVGLGGDMGSTIQLQPDPELSFKHIYLLPSNNVMTTLFEDEKVAASEGVAYIVNELRRQKCPAFPGESVEVDVDHEEDDVIRKKITGLASLFSK